MKHVKITISFPVTHDDAYRFSDQSQEFKVEFTNDGEPHCALIKHKHSETLCVYTTIGAIPFHRFVSEFGHKAIFKECLNGLEVFERIKALGPDKIYTMEAQTKLYKDRDFVQIVWKVY